MNRDAKTFHPVYNNMPFPDPLTVASRTITATCTRVSRESVVVEYPEGCGRFRRLSVRERAIAQGFPLFYQFHGSNYSSQLKMIGNAIPPNVTYAIANAMRAVPADRFVPTQETKSFDFSEIERAPEFEPDTQGRSFRAQRSFAAAIPGLRFKSGMRFELNNGKGSGHWSVEFYFGDSKRIHSVALDRSLKDEIEGATTSETVLKVLRKASERVAKIAADFEHQRLQSVWNGTTNGLHPYEIVDSLGDIAQQAINGISKFSVEERVDVMIRSRLPKQVAFNGRQKIAKYASEVFIGLYVGSVFNALTTER